MKTVLQIDEDQAREQVLEHENSEYWYEEENHVVVRNIQSVDTTTNGGIVVHTIDDSWDIQCPGLCEVDREIEPAIRIINVSPESNAN